MLWNETSPWQVNMIGAAEAAARSLGFESVGLRDADQFESIFAKVRAVGFDAAIALPDANTFNCRKRLADPALQYRVPLLHLEGAVDALMAYATDLNALFSRAASYADRLMKGATVGELPVEQPTTFRLVFNARTAKALGLAVPQSILARADEVIE